ncbi:leucine carboxyl methyltransferase 1-like isoform X2 [Ctenocephalides felis]|uniref:leucine carboxyl methyltransferase 1-like isoform X2 n=1 Tax=Ctenocephalides felis TaxID=7515 RepID=UPI000E6E4463|nr:leucine carboxyl methyltransferase 1-like isoform X2 [Ctenocephalides felis]
MLLRYPIRKYELLREKDPGSIQIGFSGDEAVIATNNDASECKKCAVNLGYWDDKYISYFVKNCERKAPEINRGYYARVKGVELFIDKFLKKSGCKSQIINLGCGFDTLYWRLKDVNQKIHNFIEIDFPTVTSRKCYAIKRNKVLLEKIHDGEIKLSTTDLHASNYHLIGLDLRNITDIENKLNQAEVNYELPTLFIAECVLVYIDLQHSQKMLNLFASRFKSALFINYEQVNMNDRFGNVMLSNLASRGCCLDGVSACANIETHQQRFLDAGWLGCHSWDMVKIYNMLSSAERERIEHIEMLDEGELLTQLFQHYCISVAWNGQLFASEEFL